MLQKKKYLKSIIYISITGNEKRTNYIEAEKKTKKQEAEINETENKKSIEKIHRIKS
jgi:hypothetical protein